MERKHIVIGLLAQVDAGKTTLSETILHEAGAIRSRGRVEHGDTFFDYASMERTRGITIFSKQTEFLFRDCAITLVDTPGHGDFREELLRVSRILDVGILVINGAEALDAETPRLCAWLKQCGLPVLVFFNKMDLNRNTREDLLGQLAEVMGNRGFVDFTDPNLYTNETLASCSEVMIEDYLEQESIEDIHINQAIEAGSVVPCFFGSALKGEGVRDLMEVLVQRIEPRVARWEGCHGEGVYRSACAFYVYKIGRVQGERYSYVRVLAGTLQVRMSVGDEKIHRVLACYGDKTEQVSEIAKGHLGVVCGLTETAEGMLYVREKPDGEWKIYPQEAVAFPPVKEEPDYRNYEDASRLKPIGQKLVPDNEPNLYRAWQKIWELSEEYPSLGLQLVTEKQSVILRCTGELEGEVLLHILEERYGYKAHLEDLYPEEEEELEEEPGEEPEEESNGEWEAAEKQLSGEAALRAIFRSTFGKDMYEDYAGNRYSSMNSAEDYENVGKKQSAADLGNSHGKLHKIEKRWLYVDGYNFIRNTKNYYGLQELFTDNPEASRERLLDLVTNYGAYTGMYEIVVVFDAYKRTGHKEYTEERHGVTLVFTRERETADAYIERQVKQKKDRYRDAAEIRVVTDDRAERDQVRGFGALPISAELFVAELEKTREEIRNQITD